MRFNFSMTKSILLAMLFLFSSTAFAIDGDLWAVILCKNTNPRPNDGALRRMEVYWDHQSRDGFVVGEYVIYKEEAMFVGKEAYWAKIIETRTSLSVEFKNKKITAFEFTKQGADIPFTWLGENFTCLAQWSL